MTNNIFNEFPDTLPEEVFSTLLASGPIRIERILSKGHTSPETGWYDQSEHEWVILLKGAATLVFEGKESQVELKAGDYLLINAHEKHRVHWTHPNDISVWLAVFFPAD